MKTKRNYKTFDQEESIRKAQKLINKLKYKEKEIRSIRIDQDTIIQIKTNRNNIDKIIERVKAKRRTISIVDQIEYGHYA